MFMDALGLVSDNQAVTATAFSTNTIDLLGANRTIGTGEPIGFGLAVDVAADITTSDETYTVEVVESDNANLSTPTVIGSVTLAAALLAIGALHWLPIAPGKPVKRYIGLRYTVAGTTPSVTVTAWLTAHKLFSIATRAYPKGYGI